MTRFFFFIHLYLLISTIIVLQDNICGSTGLISKIQRKTNFKNELIANLKTLSMIETVNNERNRYLEFFKKGIEQLKKDKNQYAIELLIESNSDNLILPFKLIRLDFIYKDEQNADRILSLQLDSIQDYQPIIETIKNTSFEIFPFCWDNCKIITGKIDTNKLIPWIETWIDIESSRYTDFSNSIHNCTMIQNIEGKDEIVVDFGTAPIESFTDLMELLIIDNKRVIIK